jgi:cob(I)alamin adenosyltransferase
MKTIDCNDSSDEARPDPALIQTALCSLMTRHTVRPCLGLVYTILHHLQMLLAHPDLAGWPELRKIHCDLLRHWRGVATQQPVACASGMLPVGCADPSSTSLIRPWVRRASPNRLGGLVKDQR